MIHNKEHALVIVELLESVADGKTTGNKALEDWPDIDSEPDDLIAASWHELSHFANDDDIRRTDSEYDKLLRAKLCEWAEKIRLKYAI